jgi:hypothetical protein
MWTAYTMGRSTMRENTTADRLVPERTPVTAAEWFAGGRRILYVPRSARVLGEGETSANPGALQVFERVTTAGRPGDTVWLTMLPGFPDGF